MKAITLIAMLLAIIGLTNAYRMSKPCFFFLEKGNGFYNLERIFKKENTTMQVEGITGNVVFNLCHKFVPEHCDAKWNAIGYIVDGSNCTPLSLRTEEAETNWDYVATDPVQPTQSLLRGVYMLKDRFLGMAQHRKYKVQLKEGVEIEKFVKDDPPQKDFGKKKGVDIVADNSKNELKYDVTFRLKCDLDAKTVQGLEGNLNDRQLTISLNHDDACSFDVMSFWDTLGNFKYVVESAIALAALAMCLCGHYWYKAAVGTIGFFGGAGAAYLFASMFLDISLKQDWYFWVEIGVCVAIGIVCCIL